MKEKTLWPKISIITPSFNQGKFIEETIRSVLSQGYPNLEYIVIDGGSTDDSIKIIKKYEDKLAFWISKKDKGQADAINKGLSHATGSLLNWLNSDDILLPGSLKLVAQAHLEHPDAIIAGDVKNFDEKGKLAIIRQRGLSKDNFAKSWMQVWEQKISYHQPGIFFPKKAWDLCGPLDISFRYCFDSDLMFRLLRHLDVYYLEEVIAGFRLHPSSKTVSQGHEFELESDRVLRKYWNHEGYEPDLKSYARAMGAKCAVNLKHGRFGEGFRIMKRGLRLYPYHTFFGFFKAIISKILCVGNT